MPAGNGTTSPQVKTMSLEGVLVSRTSAENEAALGAVGFSYIEPFWRCLNFCGWVAVKA